MEAFSHYKAVATLCGSSPWVRGRVVRALLASGRDSPAVTFGKPCCNIWEARIRPSRSPRAGRASGAPTRVDETRRTDAPHFVRRAASPRVTRSTRTDREAGAHPRKCSVGSLLAGSSLLPENATRQEDSRQNMFVVYLRRVHPPPARPRSGKHRGPPDPDRRTAGEARGERADGPAGSRGVF